MLNTVHDCSIQKGLDINLKKTRIVIFRNRGIIRDEEKWYLNGSLIEMCNEFTYFGLLFKYNGTFPVSQKTLSDQGRKATFSLLSKINNDYYNVETLLLFDAYVSSILNYGCETWGFHKANDIETLHMHYLKRILKVRRGTVNHMVYFELGRTPLYVDRYIKMVTYWLKLLSTDNCILRTIYDNMYESSNAKPNDRLNWACKIRDILLKTIWFQ